LKAASLEHYGALKRRLLSLVLDKFVYEKDVTLPEKLKAEALQNKDKLICLFPHINTLKYYLDTLDLEVQNIAFKQYRHFSRRVDPFLAFLSLAVVKRDATHAAITPMTVEHLCGFFLQYAHIVKYSRLEIKNIEH